MTQNPDGPPDPGRPGPGQPPRRPGAGGPPPWPGAPGGMTAPPRPPMTDQLRLLLRLTLVSLGLSVLNSVVEVLAAPTTIPGLDGVGQVPGLQDTGLALVATLFGVLLTAGLYALVYFPLREQRQWGWVLGLVFCSLAVLGDAFSLIVHLLGGSLLVGLSTLLLVAVNVLWLVVASKPGVRAALR